MHGQTQIFKEQSEHAEWMEMKNFSIFSKVRTNA